MREVPQAAAPTPRAQATGRDRLSQRTTHAAEVARVRPPRAVVERRAGAARLRLGPHRLQVARVLGRAPTKDSRHLARSLERLHPPGVVADREAALAVLRRFRAMQARGARIMFGHDPEFWKTVPQGPERLG